MCKYFCPVSTIASRTVKCVKWTFQCMFMHSIRIVLVFTIVSWALNNSKWAVIELVIVNLINLKFFSTSDIGTCYHRRIIHLDRYRARALNPVVMQRHHFFMNHRCSTVIALRLPWAFEPFRKASMTGHVSTFEHKRKSWNKKTMRTGHLCFITWKPDLVLFEAAHEFLLSLCITRLMFKPCNNAFRIFSSHLHLVCANLDSINKLDAKGSYINSRFVRSIYITVKYFVYDSVLY